MEFETDVPAKPSKRFPWAIYLIALFVILAVALAPVGSVVACSWVVDAHGCKVDEGSVHPCKIGGKRMRDAWRFPGLGNMMNELNKHAS